MADDGKLYIVITDKRTGTSGTGGLKDDTTKSKDDEENKLGKFALQEAIHFIKAETMQMINNSVSTYGERTGNYLAQHNVQVSLNIANKGLGIASAAIGGMTLSGGNPIGAVIGASVALTTTLINTHLEFVSLRRQVRIQNNNISLIRDRAGLNTLSDGSRGTEN